jgi:hypothetical protein
MILWNLTVLTSVGIEILQVYKQVKSVCLWSKQPTKKTTRATIPVGILLACGQILHDRIISLSAELGSNKTCLDRHFFFKCLHRQKSMRSCIYVLGGYDFDAYYHFSVSFRNSSDSVVFLIFHFICKNKCTKSPL